MKSSPKYLNEWMCIFLVSVASGSHIQFHEGDNKKSYIIFESFAETECVNIPTHLLTEWHYVKTDTCMMVYNDFDCKSLTSGRFEPGTSFSRDFLIYSFQACNKNEGGLQLNLDFTEYYIGTYRPPRILESYENVCRCINIPRFVIELDYWSINNHGNELMAYYEPNCSENVASATFILDGHSYESRNIYHLKKSKLVIQSFGPAKNSTYFYHSCLQMGTVTLPTIETSGTAEESKDTIKVKSRAKYKSTNDLEALVQKHAEEIEEINEKNRNLQEKLDYFKMNIDLILAKHKKDLQLATEKIKKDLQKAYDKEK